MQSLQDLVDEAFRDLLKKHRRPATLKEMLRESARYTRRMIIIRRAVSKRCVSFLNLMSEADNSSVGKEWSEMDIFDLKNAVDQGSSITDIADFLMRRESEVREKMVELGLPDAKK